MERGESEEPPRELTKNSTFQEKTWLDELLADNRHRLCRSRYARSSLGTTLRVGPLRREDLRNIITQVFEQLDVDRSATDDDLDRLEEVDPGLRPLFALFYAETVGTGSDTPQTKEELLEAILSREDTRIWRPVGIENTGETRKYRNLLCVATILRGLPRCDERGDKLPIVTAINQAIPGFLPDLGGSFRTDWYEALAGFADVEKRVLRRLEPDVLGEHFVRRHLRWKPDTKKLGHVAWDCASERIVVFLDHAVQEFLPSLDAEEPLHVMNSEGARSKGRTAWLLLQTKVGLHYGLAGLHESAEILFARAVAEDASPDQKAQALCNRGVAYHQMTPPETDKALDDWTAVIEMEDAPPGPKAQALFNRGVAYRSRLRCWKVGVLRVLWGCRDRLTRRGP